MGVFYNSICLPDCAPEDARDAISRWLLLRGFEPVAGTPLFDLDAECERSVFVASNERWTVLFYSAYDEEWRLVQSLLPSIATALYVWIYDSTSWGYELLRGGRFVGSFSSDPEEHLPFAERPLDLEARPPSDCLALATALGLEGRGDTLQEVRDVRAVFKEEVCRSFCRLLGVEAAVASYDELECGLVGLPEGWHLEQVRYVHRGHLPPPPRRDVHRQRVTHRNAGGVLQTGTIVIDPGVLQELDRSRQQAQLRLRMLRPVSWLSRGWQRLVEQVDRIGRGARARRELAAMSDATGQRPGYRIDGTALVNDRHRCRLDLPVGARPAMASSKPSSVLAFEVGSVHVGCTARPLATLREVLRQPDRSDVKIDERYQVGDALARHLLFRLPAGYRSDVRGHSYLGLHVLQTAQALYVFVYRLAHEPDPEAEQVIKQAVSRFRLLVS